MSMETITEENKHLAIKVLRAAFSKNPGVLFVAKKDEKLYERIDVLLKYCLDIAMHKKGAYLSSDNKGVVLIFKNKIKIGLYKSILGYINLGNNCIGWSRAFNIIQRQRKIEQKRLSNDHLYCWMLGVGDHKNGLTSIKEMRDFMFALSIETKLPIYAETTRQDNLVLYRRYGFEVYDVWNSESDKITTWFIKRKHDVARN